MSYEVHMRRITIANTKGGVGKSTTVANLGAALARMGKRVLLVDYDPQCSLSDFFMIDTDDADAMTIKDLLASPKFDPNDAIVEISKNLDLIPGHEEIRLFEHGFAQLQAQGKGGELALKKILDRIKGEYDYMIVDTPGTEGIFMHQALLAAPEVIVPIKSSDIDMKAAERFLEVIDVLSEDNSEIKVGGIVFTMHKKGSKTHKAFAENIFKGHELESCVYKTTIRDNVSLGTSSTVGKHIFDFQPNSIGAEDYMNLAREVDHV
jgi:chromosome partitioning protein